MAQTGGPAFGKAASYISDIQLSHSLSPDNKSLSILFDNFSAAIVAGGPPAATRTLTIIFPLVDTESEAELALDLRGAAVFGAGTSGTLALRVLGQTRVLDPILGLDEDPGDFVKSISVKVPSGSGSLAMSIIAEVEQDGSNPSGQALLTVDSVDLSLGLSGAEQ